MTISFTQARELQALARRSPGTAQNIIGDLIAQINSNGVPVPPLASVNTVKVETPEQREQRLLDELDTARKEQEAAAAAEKAEEAKKARLAAIHHDSSIASATVDLLAAISGQINYNSGDVVSRETWWKYRKELQPVANKHGFKLVNVGTKSKPKAALVEV